MSIAISIKGLSKADVFAALYNHAKPHPWDFATPMTHEAAEDIIAQLRRDGKPLDIDYWNARAMRVDISGDTFDPRLYDRDNGEGTARQAIAAIDGSAAQQMREQHARLAAAARHAPRLKPR